MLADTTNPFEVYEAVARLRAACKNNMYYDVYHNRDPRVKEAVKRHAAAMDKMAGTMLALQGVCSAHVDGLWWKELDKFRWWQTRKQREFIDGSAEWKLNKIQELRAAARAIKELELV